MLLNKDFMLNIVFLRFPFRHFENVMFYLKVFHKIVFKGLIIKKFSTIIYFAALNC